MSHSLSVAGGRYSALRCDPSHIQNTGVKLEKVYRCGCTDGRMRRVGTLLLAQCHIGLVPHALLKRSM